ncbi:MazG-like family protein [Streptomyces odontomachi]|uniref:MazG-like family protein n=1 Tax=Streptomyces odontomachi TaxID=2944940 RepID=UPI00210EFAB8|nr:MazG-like family protein [Streptomyces sp. ODS25]
MLNEAQWDTIDTLIAWLDGANGRDRQEITLRMMKLAEEVGEVTQAWIGFTGQNPRKGHSHSLDDVRDELCDVIITAAVALGTVTDDPGAVLDAALQRIAARRLTPVQDA